MAHKVNLKLMMPTEPVEPQVMPQSPQDQEREAVVWDLVVRQAWSLINDMISSKCYGCQHQCPSQRDHDFCCMMSVRELVEELAEEATEALDWDALQTQFLETVPLNGLERLKYETLEWFHTKFTWDEPRLDLLKEKLMDHANMIDNLNEQHHY